MSNLLLSLFIHDIPDPWYFFLAIIRTYKLYKIYCLYLTRAKVLRFVFSKCISYQPSQINFQNGQCLDVTVVYVLTLFLL